MFAFAYLSWAWSMVDKDFILSPRPMSKLVVWIMQHLVNIWNWPTWWNSHKLINTLWFPRIVNIEGWHWIEHLGPHVRKVRGVAYKGSLQSCGLDSNFQKFHFFFHPKAFATEIWQVIFLIIIRKCFCARSGEGGGVELADGDLVTQFPGQVLLLYCLF